MTMTTIDTKQDQAIETQNPNPATRALPVNDNAQQPGGNDNAHLPGAADTTVLASHPAFIQRVRGTLIRHGRRKSLEDDIAEVQVRAIEIARVGPMPPDLPRWKALGRLIAKLYAIDERRKWEVRKKYDEGLCEEPDAHGPIEVERGRDPVDTKRYLAVLKDLFDRGEMPDMGAEILWDAADDVPQEETAEETGLSVQTVKRRLKQMRERFGQRLDELGLRDGVDTGCDKSSSKADT
jgi:DNA-directed RNA polymerase specialized sigma24 family protein